jgi:hypothetical protein
MSWHPIGPDFVFAPRNSPFQRLSLRNEYGRQGLPSSIAVDPNDNQTIYIAERPSSGGASAFRTRTEGRAWTPIADVLQQANPNVDPSCFAVNDRNPTTIYMGTWSNNGVYVSADRGDNWSVRHQLPDGAAIRKLIVDPRTSASLATTVLYAAANTGVYRSADGGVTWTRVLAGDVWTLVADMPSTGTARFYAGVASQGVFYTTDPTTAWTNLNTQGIGLPAHAVPNPTIDPLGNFEGVLVDFCRRDPRRAYAWFVKPNATQFIYTCNNPTANWSQVAAVSPPSPAYGYYAMLFAVAPNSPGNGNSDILFFGNLWLSRSTDGGRNWVTDPASFHADQHGFAFFPEQPPSGTVPVVHSGNDGGIAKSTQIADPSVAMAVPSTWNEGATVLNNGAWTNRDHGKQSSAVYQYASPPTQPALSYIACQDTGINAGNTALGWRGIMDADGGSIAAATGTNGVSVWANTGWWSPGWPLFRITHFLDRGEYNPAWSFSTLGGSLLTATSNQLTGLDNNCLAGVLARLGATTTLSAAIAANPAAAQAATVAAIAGIAVGDRLVVGQGAASEEVVSVTAVGASSFSAVFTQNHAAGETIIHERSYVVRIDQSGVATQISQDFAATGQVSVLAASLTDPNILYCGTSDQHVYSTNAGAAAGPGTVWQEAATGRPALAPQWQWWLTNITDIEITPANEAYVLLNRATTVGGVTSPLFLVVGGTWTIQQCTNLPPATFTFGKLAADPSDSNVLYASNGARIYKLTRAGASWNWQDISDGLPGQWIYDLVARQLTWGAQSRVLLRTAIPTRGVWERDVTVGAAQPAIDLYVRDHTADLGWFTPSPDGVTDPYDPTQVLYHYMCADVKIDARQNRPAAGQPDYYQTDPETPTLPPLDHTLFDELVDNSQNLPQGDQAWVHVQVHNRAAAAAGNVSVWAIYCSAAAGVPSLAASASNGNAFAFWNQFAMNGTITPNLPTDSPWTSVGQPRVLSGIDAAHPQVASWNISLPLLPSGDPGHYCMVVFVHSAASLINENGLVVDTITPRNRQIGQKNLHIGPPLPPAPGPGPGGGHGPGPGPSGGARMIEYVEFHNPTDTERVADLRFEFDRLPPALRLSLQLTPLRTEAPLAEAITGVASASPISERGAIFPPKRRSWLEQLIEWLGLVLCWLLNVLRLLLGRPRRPCRKLHLELPAFEPTLYETAPGEPVLVRGVQLGAHERVAAAFAVTPIDTLEPGSRFEFDVQQVLTEGEFTEVFGGGRYVVVVDGEPKRKRKPAVATSHDQETELTAEELSRLEREAERSRYVPPHAREFVDQREQEQGKEGG